MKATFMIGVWLGLSLMLGAQSAPDYKQQIRDAFARIEDEFNESSEERYTLIELEMRITGPSQWERPVYEDKIRVISRGDQHYFWSNALTVFQDSQTTVSIDPSSAEIYTLKTPDDRRRNYMVKNLHQLNDTLLKAATVVSSKKRVIDGQEMQETTLLVPESLHRFKYKKLVFLLHDGRLYRSTAYYTQSAAYESVEITFLNYQTSYSPKESLTDPVSMVRHANGRLKETYNHYSWNDLR